MRPIVYHRPANAREAVELAAALPGSRFLAGGTNLLDLMKLDIERPSQVIDVRRLPLNRIEPSGDGLGIGAMATNSAVAADPVVRARYPLLARALLSGGSGQLRNMATIGGNLMQRTRCPYFYDVTKPCNKREPGAGCSAIGGLNRSAAILGASDACIAVHPSDLAVALLALDAQVEVLNPTGDLRTIPIAELHRLPGDEPEVETALAPGELIVAVELPPPPAPATQVYRKVRDRASFAGGLVSVAVAGNAIALGAVALKPWRALTAERALSEGAEVPEAIEAELVDAVDRGGNGFKIALTRRLTIAAMAQARSAQ